MNNYMELIVITAVCFYLLVVVFLIFYLIREKLKGIEMDREYFSNFDYLKATEPISCEECKCLINESDANIVNIISIQKYEYYYCKKCKPPYTKIVLDIYSDNKNRYYKEFEVDINGKIIK